MLTAGIPYAYYDFLFRVLQVARLSIGPEKAQDARARAWASIFTCCQAGNEASSQSTDSMRERR